VGAGRGRAEEDCGLGTYFYTELLELPVVSGGGEQAAMVMVS